MFQTIRQIHMVVVFIHINQIYYGLIETLYANVFCLYKLFIHANLRRDEGNPTYGFYNIQSSMVGAMTIAPYGI